MGKSIKVSDVEKGQRVRVESRNGMKEGEVVDITHKEGDVWITVQTGESGFMDSLHEPDGEIELAD